MGSKRVMKWSKQITSSQVENLIRAQKDIQKAIRIFDSATAEYNNGFCHDANTFNSMIVKLLSANEFISAEELLHRMKEEKCIITENIFLSFCRAYGRVHKPLDAIRIFQKMKEFECKPSPKSYITVFSILVDENQLKLALRFYRYMRKTGIPPSVTSLNVLIKALCKNSGTLDAALKIFDEMPNRGFPPDSYTYGTLVNGLCRFGKISEAKVLFQEMETKGCSPSVVTYSSLIHGLCRSGNLDEAECLFEKMMTIGIEPNVFTFSSLMDGLCKVGRSSQAMGLLDTMKGKRRMPNSVTYSSLIHGLCKEAKLQDAVDILDRMKLQGLNPDAGLYGKIITGFCNICKFQEAANFLDEMILGRISPSRVTWSLHVRIQNMVVQGLCIGNDSDRAFQLYCSMRTRGISIDASTFDSLVTCFSKKGSLQKAAQLVDEMVLDGCTPDEKIWSTVIGGFWGRRKMRKASELVQVDLISEIIDFGR